MMFSYIICIKNIIETTKSISGKIINLSLKQWFHIVESHDYMAGNISNILETVNCPDCIVDGFKGELIALKFYANTNLGEKYCVVVYKENRDSFIITAFLHQSQKLLKKAEYGGK